MGNIGIKASGSVDAFQATDPQLGFSSEFNHPKIYTSGKISGTSETVAHPFGYPLATSGYILDSGKYFIHYDKETVLTDYEFENSNYGRIKTDNDNIYLSADSADTLIYLTYVDPAIASPTSDNQQKGNIGFKFSGEEDVFTADDWEQFQTSEYNYANIVQEGAVTVTADAISAPANTSKTNIVDVPHSLGYAGHVILFDERSKNAFAYTPYATGLGPDFIVSETEVYIDSSKIRFRVSRYAESNVASISEPDTDFDFYYFLTSYRLPS